MRTNFLPLCLFPTTVIIVDDDPIFLRSLDLILNCSDAAYQSFSNSVKAEKFLRSKYFYDPFVRRIVTTTEQHEFNVDIENLYKEAYNSKRFNQISVIILDYDMPGLDGITLSKSIKSVSNKIGPIKTLLLTGAASNNMALDAFNEKLIDGFIDKASENFQDKINSLVKDLQGQYFINLSKSIISYSTSKYIQKNSYLTDIGFIRFFNKLIEKQSISEYYALDNSGSFLLASNNGKLRLLIVRSEDEMHTMYKQALNSQAADKTLEMINNRSALAFFPKNVIADYNSCLWEQYLFPARMVEGRDDLYYCAVINDTSIFNIDKNKIINFNTYRKNL